MFRPIALMVVAYLLVASPVIATTHLTPTLFLIPLTTTETTTTYGIILIGNQEPVNLIEFEILIAVNAASITSPHITNHLCRPELTIANTITATSWYVACGSYIPLTADIAMIATFDLPATVPISSLSFGEHTHLYAHDGHGTEIRLTTHIWSLMPLRN